MTTRMVPQIIGSPGRVSVIDKDGCMSLEVETDRDGDTQVCRITDWSFPGCREPREARFYSVSDRILFVRALLDERLKSLAIMPARRWHFVPKLVRA